MAESATDRLYDCAEPQVGYFTAAQAMAAGVSPRMLTHYTHTGRIMRVQRGLYRLVRFPATPYEDLMAAWLAAGPEAAISHDSALAVHRLSDALPSQAHITVPPGHSRRRQRVRFHIRALAADETEMREGFRVTTVARTIVDVATSGLSEELVRQAVREALRRGMTTERGLLAAANRRGGRAGLVVTQAAAEART